MSRRCKIKKCSSTVGSMFRVPWESEDRKKWIEAIETHQEFDYCAISYNICESHFPKESIIKTIHNNGMRSNLKAGTVPSIFPSSEINFSEVTYINSKDCDQTSNMDDEELIDINRIKKENEQETNVNYVELIDINMIMEENEDNGDTSVINEFETTEMMTECESCKQFAMKLKDAEKRLKELQAKVIVLTAQNELLKSNQTTEQNSDNKPMNSEDSQSNDDPLETELFEVVLEDSNDAVLFEDDIVTETPNNIIPSTSATVVSTSAEAIQKPFKCGYCDMAFEFPLQLNKHMKQHPDSLEIYQKCTICKMELKSNEMKSHLCGKENQIQCEYCPENFMATQDLLKHLDSHENKKLYRCKKCPTFLSMVALRDYHMQVHEDNLPKKFVCNLCPKAFATIEYRKRHEDTHYEAKDHLCDECGKGFASFRSLEIHKNSAVHGKQPTMSCPHCPKKFFRKFTFDVHMETHQNNIYVCEICKKEFYTKSTFRKHMKRHSRTEADRKYQCKICEMKFFDHRHLKSHEPVHSTKKLHNCSVCSQSFKYPGDLNKHLRTHFDGMIYKCTKCLKRFKYQKELKQHELKHYQDESKTEMEKNEEMTSKD